MALRQLVEAIVDGIAEKPYEVRITLNDTHIGIFVDKADVARIIGKNGFTIAAIRTIVNAFAKIEGRCIGVSVNEKQR
ncbi:MAG: KH domain-containing protein [Oscillospiraceae bacterium]